MEQSTSSADRETLDELQSDPSNSAPVEPPTVDKIVRDIGLGLTASTEECEAYIRYLSDRSGFRGPVLIGRLIGAMCKSHLPLVSDEVIRSQPSNVLSGGLPNQENLSSTSQQEEIGWSIDVLLRSVAAVEPHIEWKDVVREFDHTGFRVCDRAGLRFLWELLIKAFDGIQRIPMEMVYAKWHNLDSQLQLLKQILMCPDIVELTACSPCTKLEPAVDTHGSKGTTVSDGESASPLIANWAVLEIHEALLSLSERHDLSQLVIELYKQAAAEESCHDSITLALLQVQSPTVPLRRILLLELIARYLGESTRNSKAVLYYAWNRIPKPLEQEVHLIVTDAMVERYMDHIVVEQTLPRILQLAHEINCLPNLLALPRSPEMASHPSSQAVLMFVLDLACLVSRKENLRLDVWMHESMTVHRELFTQASLKLLTVKIPYLTDPKLGDLSLLPDDTVCSILRALWTERCHYGIETPWGDEVVRMMENRARYASGRFGLFVLNQFLHVPEDIRDRSVPTIPETAQNPPPTRGPGFFRVSRTVSANPGNSSGKDMRRLSSCFFKKLLEFLRQ